MSMSLNISWKSKQGLTFIFLTLGWSIIFQIIPTLDTFNVMNFGKTNEESLIIIIGLIFAIVSLMSINISTVENFSSENNISDNLAKLTIILFITMIAYEVGFVFAVPIIEASLPFINPNLLSTTTPPFSFVVSIVIGICFSASIWVISEIYYKSRPRRT
ncbi:MAG: hypothetical protein ACFFD1_11195 [Candidatus Thorarchaeota archaeon]